jgi:hypothetical protein
MSLDKKWSFLPVVLLLAIFGSALYTTLRGKFMVWAELLDRLELRGDERILDTPSSSSSAMASTP